MAPPDEVRRERRVARARDRGWSESTRISGLCRRVWTSRREVPSRRGWRSEIPEGFGEPPTTTTTEGTRRRTRGGSTRRLGGSVDRVAARHARRRACGRRGDGGNASANVDGTGRGHRGGGGRGGGRSRQRSPEEARALAAAEVVRAIRLGFGGEVRRPRRARWRRRAPRPPPRARTASRIWTRPPTAETGTR